MPSLIEKYNRLGPKTYFMILLGRMSIFILFCVLFIAYIISRSYYPILEQYSPDLILSLSILVGIIIFIISLVLADLEYSNYSISLESDDLMVKKGIIEIKEQSVPYRYIRDIRVYQSIIDRLVGISNLTITLEMEPEVNSRSKSEIILNSIDNSIALDIHRELLKRAEVQKIDVTGSLKNT